MDLFIQILFLKVFLVLWLIYESSCHDRLSNIYFYLISIFLKIASQKKF